MKKDVTVNTSAQPAAQATGDLYSIVYLSSAVAPLQPREIDYLLTRARARNTIQNLTGALLYCNDNFLQYLEGPQQNLMRVYQIIKGSPQHRQLIELVAEPIQYREFADWTMAYRVPDVATFTELSQASWLGGAASTSAATISKGRAMLRQFWQLNFFKPA